MNKFYRILMQFSGGTTPTRKSLLHSFDESLVDEAITLRYIIEIGTTDIGEPKYAITELGKQIRDN